MLLAIFFNIRFVSFTYWIRVTWIYSSALLYSISLYRSVTIYLSIFQLMDISDFYSIFSSYRKCCRHLFYSLSHVDY